MTRHGNHVPPIGQLVTWIFEYAIKNHPLLTPAETQTYDQVWLQPPPHDETVMVSPLLPVVGKGTGGPGMSAVAFDLGAV